MKKLIACSISVFFVLYFLLTTNLIIEKTANASPTKNCKLSVRSYAVSPQSYGVLAAALFDCGGGISFACEPLDVMLDVVNISTGQVYHKSTTLSLDCGNSSNTSVWLALPSGSYQYTFQCVGSFTKAYYVSTTGFFSR